MYSKVGDAILVITELDPHISIPHGFSPSYPLHCPVCQFEIVSRTSDPSRDEAIFFEGMRYLAGDREFEVIVETG